MKHTTKAIPCLCTVCHHFYGTVHVTFVYLLCLFLTSSSYIQAGDKLKEFLNVSGHHELPLAFILYVSGSVPEKLTPFFLRLVFFAEFFYCKKKKNGESHKLLQYRPNFENRQTSHKEKTIHNTNPPQLSSTNVQ